MSGNENNDGIPTDIPKDSSNAAIAQPTDSASNEVRNETVNNESAASVVGESEPSVSVQKDDPETLQYFDTCPPNSKYMSDLMKASNLHCPFVWRKDLDTSMYLDHEIDLLSSAEEMFDDLGFRFRRFIVNLVLCYHNFYKRNIKECMDHLDELDRMMTKSSKKDSSDYLFNTINDALYHVIHSCRIYIYDTTNQKERTQQILNKIKSYDSMNPANKAGLWAIRANVYVEYGYEGVKNAVSYMRKAVIIDPENAYWHFMKGMFMGRLRRMEASQIMPENEEFHALRTAIELREDPAFIAFAGEAYLETAKTAKKLHSLKKSDKDSEKQVASLLQGLNEVAAKYFKTSIELKPNSSHLLFRCGKGLMNLPPPHQDVRMGLDFIRKGLEICPDSGYGNHVMAMFLDKIEKNSTLAKEFLDISIEKKNFPAHLDLIRIEFQESKNAQKLWGELEKMLELYKEMPRRRKIIGEMVCFRLFIDYDLVEACFYMKKLIQMNSTSVDVINNHRTMILPVASSIPLSDLVFNRIKASLKDRKLSDLGRQVFKKYIQFLIDENIEPKEIKDEMFSKMNHEIERGFKNKQTKPVDESVRLAQKRIRSANEFEGDPCAEEELNYLDFYKNDLKDTNVGKTRGVRDDLMSALHSMGQNPLPKRRFNDDTSDEERRERENGRSSRHRRDEKERRRHSESSRSSRSHRRRRSYSSSSRSGSSSSSSSYHRSSRKGGKSSRNRRRSPSSVSSYSSSSSYSSDRYSKSSRRSKNRRRRSSSYDSKRSRNRHRRRDTSRNTKSRHHKKSKRNRSPSSSYSSSSETSASSRSDRTLRRPSKKETNSVKPMDPLKDIEAATKASHPVEQLPKTDVETYVDHVQAVMKNLSIDSPESSRSISSQPTGGAESLSDVGAEKSSQNDEKQQSSQVEEPELAEKPSKQKENRDDSDGSVKTATSHKSGVSKRSSKRRSRDRSVDSIRTNSSRVSQRKGKSSKKRRSSSRSRSSSRDSSGGRSKRSSKRRSRDRSVESVRTNSSRVSKKSKSSRKRRSGSSSRSSGRDSSGERSKRSSKRRSRDRSVESVRTNSSRVSKKSKSSRKRRSSSSSRSSSRDRSSDRSSSRRTQRSEQRLTNSPDLIRRSDSATPDKFERRSKDDSRKDRHREKST